jgi:hypothetical protein
MIIKDVTTVWPEIKAITKSAREICRPWPWAIRYVKKILPQCQYAQLLTDVGQGPQLDLRASNTPALIATDPTSPGTAPPISTEGNNAYSTIAVDHAIPANMDRLFEPAESPIHRALPEYD